MGERDKKTEEKILEAAKNVFIINGKDGARMQAIADGANINKALLHYYYRSKDKLFDAVFEFAFKTIFPDLKMVAENEDPVFNKIERFCEMYISLVMKNPFIPMFVLNELSKPNNKTPNLFKHLKEPIHAFLIQLEAEMEKGNIRKMDPRHIMINMVSMCIFPFIAKPIALPLFFNEDKKAFKEFILSRKKEVVEFVINSIKIERDEK